MPSASSETTRRGRGTYGAAIGGLKGVQPGQDCFLEAQGMALAWSATLSRKGGAGETYLNQAERFAVARFLLPATVEFVDAAVQGSCGDDEGISSGRATGGREGRERDSIRLDLQRGGLKS